MQENSGNDFPGFLEIVAVTNFFHHLFYEIQENIAYK